VASAGFTAQMQIVVRRSPSDGLPGHAKRLERKEEGRKREGGGAELASCKFIPKHQGTKKFQQPENKKRSYVRKPCLRGGEKGKKKTEQLRLTPGVTQRPHHRPTTSKAMHPKQEKKGKKREKKKKGGGRRQSLFQGIF